MGWFRTVLLACLLAVGLLAGQMPPARAQSITDGSPIGAIRIEGNQRVEADTIVSYMGIKPGDPFDARLIDQALKNLFATSLFADVNLRREDDALIVVVTENPIINKIAFEGNDRLDDEALQSEIQLRPRLVFTQAKAQADVKRLLDLYRRNGRFAATVDPKIIKLDQNRVNLVFEIKEGDVTEVERIDFVGNKAFSDSTLRGEIVTQESAFYRFLTTNDRYDPDRLTVDKEQLRKFYLSEGYADFRVVSAVAELSPDQESFFITFTVDEGERYKLGTVDIKSSLKDLDPEILKGELLMSEGDWYDASLVEKTAQAMTEFVASLGYAFVEVRPRIARDAVNHILNLTFEVQEGPKVYVERIDITGNVRTQDKVIRREFRLAEGDAFSALKIKRTKQRLDKLDFFETVDIGTAPGSASDKVVVKVRVAEKSTGQITFGAGFSTSDGPLGHIGLRERNLLGKGQDLRLDFSISGRRSTIDLSFTDPYFQDTDISAGFDLFHRRYGRVRDNKSDLTQTGFGLRAGYDLTEFTRHTLGYRLSVDDLNHIASDTSAAIRDEKGTTIRSTLISGLMYDKRDNVFDPHEGYYTELRNEFAGLGGDVTYISGTLRGGYYYPATDDLTIGVSGEVGYIQPLFGDHLRVTDAFSLGGENLRGFRTSGVGPRDDDGNDSLGGQFIFDGTVQATFPIGLPEEYNVKARAFTDFGILTGTDFPDKVDKQILLQDDASLRLSVGAGLTWISPFGPLGVDIAFPVLKEDYDRTEWFRFNVGTSF